MTDDLRDRDRWLAAEKAKWRAGQTTPYRVHGYEKEEK